MQEKEDLFGQRLNDYMLGEISDAEKAELFALVRSSETFRKQFEEAAKLMALLSVPKAEEEKEKSFSAMPLIIGQTALFKEGDKAILENSRGPLDERARRTP